MRATIRALAALTLAGALLLAGCSGAGVSTAELRGGPLQTFASNHLAAFVLTRSWLLALHGLPGEETTCEPETNYEFLPNGDMRLTGIASDCCAYDYLIRADGSGEGTFDVGGVNEIWMLWGAPVTDGSITTVGIEKVFADGTRMVYEWAGDYAAAPFAESYAGTLTLADDRAMQFSAIRRTAEEETVTVDLPDGSHCRFNMPLRSVDANGFAADFAAGLEGEYVSPAGARLQFEGSGNQDRLTGWTSTVDGLAGEFSVGEEYDCEGQLLRGGEVGAALRWSGGDDGVLELLTGERAEVGPAGAALDFAIDRWIRNAALLGPTPLY